MKKKLFGILATALLFIIISSGCDLRPLSIGFGGHIGLLSPIQVAVKSNRRIFDIDDVTLDFYFGHSEYVCLNEETDITKSCRSCFIFLQRRRVQIV